MAGFNDALKSLTTLMLYQMQNQRHKEDRAFSAAQASISREFRKKESEKSREFALKQQDINTKQAILNNLMQVRNKLYDKNTDLHTAMAKLTGIADKYKDPDFSAVAGVLVDNKADLATKLNKAIDVVDNQIADISTDLQLEQERAAGFTRGGQEYLPKVYEDIRNLGRVEGNRVVRDSDLVSSTEVSPLEETIGFNILEKSLGRKLNRYEKAGFQSAEQATANKKLSNLIAEMYLMKSMANLNKSETNTGKIPSEAKASISRYRQYLSTMKAIAARNKDHIKSYELLSEVDAAAPDVAGALNSNIFALAEFVNDHYDKMQDRVLTPGGKVTIGTLLDEYNKYKNSTDKKESQKALIAAKTLVDAFAFGNATTSNLDLDSKLFASEDPELQKYFENGLKAYKELVQAHGIITSGENSQKTDIKKISDTVANQTKISINSNGGEDESSLDNWINSEQKWLKDNLSKYKATSDSVYNADKLNKVWNMFDYKGFK